MTCVGRAAAAFCSLPRVGVQESCPPPEAPPVTWIQEGKAWNRNRTTVTKTRRAPSSTEAILGSVFPTEGSGWAWPARLAPSVCPSGRLQAHHSNLDPGLCHSAHTRCTRCLCLISFTFTLFVRQRVRNTEQEFHLLVHSSNALQSQGWARHPTQPPRWVAGTQVLSHHPLPPRAHRSRIGAGWVLPGQLNNCARPFSLSRAVTPQNTPHLERGRNCQGRGATRNLLILPQLHKWGNQGLGEGTD